MLAIVLLVLLCCCSSFLLGEIGIPEEVCYAAVKAVYDGKGVCLSTKLVIERSVLPDSPLHDDADEA